MGIIVNLKEIYFRISNLYKFSGWFAILAFNSACSNYELKEEAMKYLSSLPNWFEFDAQMMEELEENAKKYGKPLEYHNFIERWDNLYFDLIDQYMIWGKYDKAKNLIEKINYFNCYGDSFGVVPLVYLSTQEYEEFYSRVNFKRIEKLNPDFGVENMRKILKPPEIESFSLLDPGYFQNPTIFYYWFYSLFGGRMLLLISAGLYGEYYEGIEEVDAIKTLDKILLSDEYQVGFINRVKYGGYAFFPFLLTTHNFYEKYLRKIGDINKVEKLKTRRFELAKIYSQVSESGDDDMILLLLDSRGELPAAKTK